MTERRWRPMPWPLYGAKTVAAHQAGNAEAALAGYDAVLAEQPAFAPALYLSGVLLRQRGAVDAAHEALGRSNPSRAGVFGSARGASQSPPRAWRCRRCGAAVPRGAGDE